MNAKILQRIRDWLDDAITTGKELKTVEVTEECLAANLYDAAEKRQAMLDGFHQKSRNLIKGRFRFNGRSFMASKGIYRERSYQRDKFLSSDEMKERHQYFCTKEATDQKTAAYWALMHGEAYGQRLPLGFTLSPEDEAVVTEWVANEMQ